MRSTVRDNLRYGKEIAAERTVGKHVPYTAHLDPYTVGTKDGSIVQAAALDGIAFETMDAVDLNHLKSVFNTVLRGVASSRLALWHTVLRRRVQVDLDGPFVPGFARDFNRARAARFSTQPFFANEHYLTIARRPSLAGSIGFLQGWTRFFSEKSDAASLRLRAARERKELDDAVELLLRSLAPFGPRRLGVYDSESGAQGSSLLEFLFELINLRRQPVLLSPIPLDRYLPCSRISFGRAAIEVAGPARCDTNLCALLSIKEYAPDTAVDLLDDLFRLPQELVWTQTFAFVDREPTLRALALQRRQMRNAEDEALTLLAQLEEASDSVASGQVVFGEHHGTLLVRARTMDELDRAVSVASAELTNVGLLVVREDLNLEPAYWAQLPGNSAYVARRALVSSLNFAGFASFHNFPAGRSRGNHWGPAITVLETTSSTPHHFNFHHGDLGHFTVIGRSGSGKTVVLNTLLNESQRIAPRCIFFDKDRGAEIFLRAIGGTYRVLRPGHPTGMNPLQLPDTPADRAFLANDWLASLVRPPDGSALTPQDRAVIAAAVAANYEAPPDLRRIGHLQELFRGHERRDADSVHARLGPFFGSGDRSWLFDHKTDDLSFDTSILGFDLTYLLEDPIARVPTLAYLFHCIDRMLDGRPTLIFLDEAWKALDDPLFEVRLKDWLKTLRKKNAVLGFGTQSSTDVLRSRISDTLREQCATQIFLPNHKADREAYCRGFGLTSKEYELVRTLPDSSRCFLLKQGTSSVVARLDLTGMGEYLAVLSGQEHTVALLDQIRADVGDDPNVWLPIFRERMKA